jgi:hypothetical protein
MGPATAKGRGEDARLIMCRASLISEMRVRGGGSRIASQGIVDCELRICA